MKGITSVGIFEDNPVTAFGIQAVLAELESVQIIFMAHNYDELLVQLEHQIPDILMMDVIIGGVSGLDAFHNIEKSHPEIKRIAFSNVMSLTIIKAIYATGVKAFISKNTPIDTVKSTVSAVIAGKTVFPEELKNFLGPHTLLQTIFLTDREKDVLKGIVHGKNTKELAKSMYLSESTIEFHRKNLLQKFEAQNVAELVRLALQIGDY